MWKPNKRNFNNIQFEKYRVKVDKKFNDLHDELSDCYYNFWREGKSKKFNAGDKKFDVQKTKEESKKLFDQLHGLIFHLHEEALEEEHNNTSEKDKDNKFEERKINYQKREKFLQQRNNYILTMKKKGIEINI